MNLYHVKYFKLTAVTILLIRNTLMQTDGNKFYEVCEHKVYFLPWTDCAHKGLEKIPDNLDSSALNISHNQIRVVRRVDFQYCTRLISLKFVNNSVTPKIENDAFVDLHSLNIAVFGEFNLSGTAIIFPLNLNKLSMRNTKINENNADLSNLSKLEYLHLSGNLLTRLPKMHKFAPLKLLELQNNPLKKFSAKQIARYCHLNRLRLSSRTEAFRHHRCECIRLREWFKLQSHLKMTLEDEIIGQKFECIAARPCREVLITDRMQELFNNCRNQSNIELDDDYDPNSVEVDDQFEMDNLMDPKIFIALALIIVLSIVTVTAYFLYLKLVKKPKEVNNSVESNRDELVEEMKEIEEEDNQL